MRRMFIVLMACVMAASASAVDTSSVPDRLRDIRPGEWIVLRDTSGLSGDTNRITVVAREGDSVTLRREHYDAGGALVATVEDTLDIGRYARRGEDVKAKALEVTQEYMMIDGKGHDVVGLLWEDTDKTTGATHQYKVLLSREAPITGVVRFWTSNPDAPNADVIAYGYDG